MTAQEISDFISGTPLGSSVLLGIRNDEVNGTSRYVECRIRRKQYDSLKRLEYVTFDDGDCYIRKDKWCRCSNSGENYVVKILTIEHA